MSGRARACRMLSWKINKLVYISGLSSKQQEELHAVVTEDEIAITIDMIDVVVVVEGKIRLYIHCEQYFSNETFFPITETPRTVQDMVHHCALNSVLLLRTFQAASAGR